MCELGRIMQGNKVKRTSEIGCGVAGHRKILFAVCAGMVLAVAVALARDNRRRRLPQRRRLRRMRRLRRSRCRPTRWRFLYRDGQEREVHHGAEPVELRAAGQPLASRSGAASLPADEPAAAGGDHAGHQQLDPGQRFQFEQESAITFLLQVLHRNDRAFVEGFDVQTDVEQGFTNNIDLLSQGIHRLRPGGGTALYDSLYSACKDQMLTLREEGVVRKAIVLVSDGDDDFSHALETDAIKECQRAETIVYAISTDVSPSRDKGDKVLHDIAEATGGQAFYPIKIEDVALGFISIEEELRSQYLLEYRPANFKLDGAFRTIYLHANDPRYHVRAHTGYFAPKAAE